LRSAYFAEERNPQMEYMFSGQLVGVFTVALGILFIIYMRKNRSNEPVQDEVIEAYLVDIKNVTRTQEHKIDKKITTIGRMGGTNTDIRIVGSTVSSTHAQIEYRNGRFYLTDLRSRNGTYMSDGTKKIEGEVYLKDGDIIAFDKYKFRFVMPFMSRRRAQQLSSREPHNHTILRTQ